MATGRLHSLRHSSVSSTLILVNASSDGSKGVGLTKAYLGPDANIIWVALAYTLGLAICLTLVGRLSDIFGRRWFFIGGSLVALLGTIVCAVAQNVPTLIVGMVFVGVAAGAQMSFYWVLSELVPMEHRFIWNSGIYAIAIPFVALGPKISQSFQTNTSVRWRGTLYTMIGVNTLSTVLWFSFYHPPTFHMLHKSKSRMQIVKDFDFLGLFLFSAGLLLFLMGLSWASNILAHLSRIQSNDRIGWFSLSME